MVLRTPLSQLVPTLKRLKYKDLELEFEREAKKILAEAERDLPEIQEKQKAEPEEVGPKVLFSKCAVEPATQILESWRELELELRDLAKKHAIAFAKSTRSLIAALESQKLITNEMSKIILDLSAFRNKVAHSEEQIITYASSSDFKSSVRRVSLVINDA